MFNPAEINLHNVKDDVFNTFLMKQGSVALLKNFISDWVPMSWDINTLIRYTEGQTVAVKIGKPYNGGRVPLESECEFKDQDLGETFRLLATYNDNSKFYYAGYTHLATLNDSSPEFHAFDWNWSGLKNVSSKNSTLWAGSKGSFTPCHKDSYGCNLHAQVIGCKEWHLWPPETDLSPTRVPYEESSTFSSVDVLDEKYSKSALRIVTTPGDVIFIPRHWWHLARNTETSVSINTWIELPTDPVDRLKEAITRLLVCNLKGTYNQKDWVNPGEEITCQSDNEALLKGALTHCLQSPESVKTGSTSKIDSYFIIDKTKDMIKDSIQQIPLPTRSPAVAASKDCNIVDTVINSIVCNDQIVDSISEKLFNSFPNFD